MEYNLVFVTGAADPGAGVQLAAGEWHGAQRPPAARPRGLLTSHHQLGKKLSDKSRPFRNILTQS